MKQANYMKKNLLFLLLTFCFPFVRGEFVVPSLPSSPVYDEVGLLKTEEKTSLEQQILTLESSTHHQIGIAIIKSLQGRTIEEAGILIARAWWIGQKWLDNGLLILVAPTEREMRIEVGRGLEWVITDLMSHRIIEENFKTHFQSGEYAIGLWEGIDRLSPLLRWEVVDLPEKDTENPPYIFMILIGLWMFGSILSSTKSWWLGGVFWAIIGWILGSLSGVLLGCIIGLGVDFVLSTVLYKKIGFWSKGWGFWGGGFWGGSSGGGWWGFWGGGFWGGGSSGKW